MNRLFGAAPKAVSPAPKAAVSLPRKSASNPIPIKNLAPRSKSRTPQKVNLNKKVSKDSDDIVKAIQKIEVTE